LDDSVRCDAALTQRYPAVPSAAFNAILNGNHLDATNQSPMQRLLNKILNRSNATQRYIVAIAGPPGAGKSTLALVLAQQLPNAKVVPMDGFHYDNDVLDELGLRARKGSPETFDFRGFEATLKRIHACEPDIAIPIFDRKTDLARAGADLIREHTKVVIVEGNYLLLDEAPWTDLTKYFDLPIFIDVSRAELQKRLMKRWLDHGRTPEEAEHWVVTNDMPNVDRVLNARRADNEDLLA
jgi:pantothenate kinase